MFSEPQALEERVAALSARSLVVWGDDEPLHASASRHPQAAHADSGIHLMRDMGHAPMIERPAETALDSLCLHGRQA